MKTILIIDDNDSYREVAAAVLLAADYDVLEANCPDKAFELLAKGDRVDLILCDLHMPFTLGARYSQFEHSHRVGIKTIRELSQVFTETPVVALTGTAASDLAKIARLLQDIPTFEKPDSGVELLKIVERSLMWPSLAYRQ
jgi:CheY-like chemotaxis protein